MSRNKGFTLIELLVVIAIIGLLSSIILAALSTAKQSAKNASSNEEVHQIQIALEEYYDDNGTYPGASMCVNTVCCIGTSCTYNGTAIAAGQSITLNTLPSTENGFDLSSPHLATAVLGTYLSSFPTTAAVTISTKTYQGFFYQCTATSNGLCTDAAVEYAMYGKVSSCSNSGNYIITDNTNSLCWKDAEDLGATPEGI